MTDRNTVETVAERLGVSQQALIELIREGRLRIQQPGKRHQRDLINKHEAAEILQVTPQRVNFLLKAGRIQTVGMDGQEYIPRDFRVKPGITDNGRPRLD